MTGKFQVQFLEDAAEFLDNLDEKPREKFTTTFRRPDFLTTKNYLKN